MKTKWKPSVDLHYHLDAMSPTGIEWVSDLHGLPLAGKSKRKIIRETTVPPGYGTWDDWYLVHTYAREQVFRHPDVFTDVARAAVHDARREKLTARVMRYSTSMGDFCFHAMHGRKPNFSDKSDRHLFLDIFSQITDNLAMGLAESPDIHTPLVISLSYQDKLRPILPELVALLARNHMHQIVGVDLTNEQCHVLPTDYRIYVDVFRCAGAKVLTMHLAEKRTRVGDSDDQGRRLYTPEERILSAMELEPDLLGHATWAVESERSLLAIKQRGAVVELCPSAHMYQEPFVSDPSTAPFVVFSQHDIPFTFNSDTPGTIEGGSLWQEYQFMQQVYGLSEQQMREIDDVAIETFQRLYA